MKISGRIALFFLMLLVLGGAQRTKAQERTGPPDGWQGPWPIPQQSTPKPAPQSPYPSGTQVMEIPPQIQQSLPPSARQQLEIPSRVQSDTPRPTQLLTVTVTDPQGRYVPGLQPEDFFVYEEDRPQRITYFSTGQEEPVSLGFLVDVSGSMANKIERARHALRRFFATIRPHDEIFLEAFNERVAMVQDFTDSRILLDQGTSLLEPMGDTALYDAMIDGLRHIKKGRRQKRALVLLTDGLDTASIASMQETVHAVRRSGVTVYTIGIGNPSQRARRMGSPSQQPFPGGGIYFPGSRWPGIGLPGGGFPGMGLPPSPRMGRRSGGFNDAVDVQVLQTFSDETGGRRFLLHTADVLGNDAVLDRATQTISEELRQQYTIGYNSPLRGDVYRGVRVEVQRPDLSVRTQKGSG